MDTTSVTTIYSVARKTIAIVVFRRSEPRPIHYQVTLDPATVSPSGRFIRFGNHAGDEITGWQPIDSLEIVEVLAEYDGDKVPVLILGHDQIQMSATRTTPD